MATYIALAALSLSSEGRFIEAGQTFTTDITPPGSAWDPQDDDAHAAVAARNNPPESKPSVNPAADELANLTASRDDALAQLETANASADQLKASLADAETARDAAQSQLAGALAEIDQLKAAAQAAADAAAQTASAKGKSTS